MKPLHIAAAGAFVLVVPLVVGLLEMLWLPLGVMLLVVGLALHLVQTYHSRRLDEAGRRGP